MELKELINKDFCELVLSYPKLLKPVCHGKFWKIDGCIDVIDDEGGYWDTYQVSLFVPLDYPNNIPVMQEIGEKIKRDINWHISEDGFCCLATRAKMFYDLREGITLLKWLNEFALPFLANHIFRLKTGSYAHQEFTHGTKGIIEGWEKITGINGTVQILEHLKKISGYRTQSLNKPCFCGGGKKYKRCYEINPSEHRYNIPYKEIRKDIEEICKYLSKLKIY